MVILKKLLRSLKNLFRRKRSQRRKKKTSSACRLKIPKSQSTAKFKTKSATLPKSNKSRIKPKPQGPSMKLKAPAVVPLQLGPKVGRVTHFFDRIQVCVIELTHRGLKKGETVTILGKANPLIQKITSMQIESVDVAHARKGQLIGLKVEKLVKVGDEVFRTD